MKTTTNTRTTRRRLTPEESDAATEALLGAINRRRITLTELQAARIERLAHQLEMDRDQLASQLVDQAIQCADNALAVDCWPLFYEREALVDEFDATSPLDGMSIMQIDRVQENTGMPPQRVLYLASSMKHSLSVP